MSHKSSDRVVCKMALAAALAAKAWAAFVWLGTGMSSRPHRAKSPMLHKGSDRTVCKMTLAAATADHAVLPAAQSF